MATSLDRLVLDKLAKVGWMRASAGRAIQLSKEFGIVVLQDARLQGRARRVRLSVGGPRTVAAVYIRPEPRPERRQWAVAHEIREHFARPRFWALGVEPTKRLRSGATIRRTRLPNDCCCRRRGDAPEGAACDWDLLRLKQCFATASHELIARRVRRLPRRL